MYLFSKEFKNITHIHNMHNQIGVTSEKLNYSEDAILKYKSVHTFDLAYHLSLLVSRFQHVCIQISHICILEFCVK